MLLASSAGAPYSPPCYMAYSEERVFLLRRSMAEVIRIHLGHPLGDGDEVKYRGVRHSVCVCVSASFILIPPGALWQSSRTCAFCILCLLSFIVTNGC